MGHKVIGVDVRPAKVEMLDPAPPIIEARMSELVAEAKRASRLHATTDATEASVEPDVSFVAWARRVWKNGKLDLSHIESVARGIGGAIRQKKSAHVFVLRSTVLPGTTGRWRCRFLKRKRKKCGRDFTVCYRPGVHARRQARSPIF